MKANLASAAAKAVAWLFQLAINCALVQLMLQLMTRPSWPVSVGGWGGVGLALAATIAGGLASTLAALVGVLLVLWACALFVGFFEWFYEKSDTAGAWGVLAWTLMDDCGDAYAWVDKHHTRILQVLSVPLAPLCIAWALMLASRFLPQSLSVTNPQGALVAGLSFLAIGAVFCLGDRGRIAVLKRFSVQNDQPVVPSVC